MFFFSAGGRAGIPPVMNLPVGAARTAEAVTGLFWLDAMKMFSPLDVPEDDAADLIPRCDHSGQNRSSTAENQNNFVHFFTPGP